MAPTPILPPGSTIGILGGGQLGRMMALAAAELGYRCHIFCPNEGEPATQVCDRATIAAYDDAAAIAAFSGAVDVVTYEFENIPAATAAALAQDVPLHPGADILAVCQDRLREKDKLGAIGVATTRYAEVRNASALQRAVLEVGRPAILKSARHGYDGKGQVPIAASTDLAAAWAEMAGSVAHPVGVLEARVDFDMEISVVVARDAAGTVATYVPVENRHIKHVLARTTAPARIGANLADLADATARQIAAELGLIGVLAVEMFVTTEGELLVNELAPRPHNSGHWTIDACPASQFEQHIRAIVGLPLASTERMANAVMDNLLGEDVARWREIAADQNARLHLYGKTQARPGRKMGHVTRLYPRESW